MNDLSNTILTFSVTGICAGGVLGTLHYILRPLNLPNLANYTIGSFIWVAAASIALLHEGVTWLAVLGLWLVLGWSGAFDGATYLFDAIFKRRRKGEVDRYANETNRAETVSSHSYVGKER
jgi:hypothetical protein